MITENLSILQIHKLTQEQYDREVEADRIDESAMYLTPDEEITAEKIGARPDTWVPQLKEIPGSEDIFMKNPQYTATPETLAEILSTAQENSTITLTASEVEYSLISLVGRSACANNITIVGTEGAIVAGVCITSGIKSSEVIGKYKSDISQAIMPKNLTFKLVTFSNPFSLRNCDITGLTIDTCTFLEGATIELVPNAFGNFYGGDDDLGTQITVMHYATRRAHNVTIKDCDFINSNNEKVKTAILVKSIDGIAINGNEIYAAAHNGIQLTGSFDMGSKDKFDARNTGKIAISNNTIRNTGSRSVRLDQFENADITFVYNKMYNANLNPEEAESNGEEILKASNYDTTTTINTKLYRISTKKPGETNTYNDVEVVTGTQVILNQSLTATEEALQKCLTAANFNFVDGTLYITT